MKENIESKYIGNRKFIIELRFDSKGIILDKKGEIIDVIKSLDIFPKYHWEIGQSGIIIKDGTDENRAKNAIRITHNLISIMSYQIDTVASFYDKFEKIYRKLREILGDFDILRIGCRIMGTYYTASTQYSMIVQNFKRNFPSNIFLDKYPAKDMLFNVVYENGMYQIGPVSETDIFYAREFDVTDCKKHVGVAIDTDNYILRNKNDINDMSLIKDIYRLSLSVEKDLYSNLKDF